ncbi:MAG: hypothetical protein ABSC05_37160 [Candidatus Solibacter sp.]
MPSDTSTSFSASYDSTTRFISAAILLLLLALGTAIHSIVVGCLGALLLLSPSTKVAC